MIWNDTLFFVVDTETTGTDPFGGDRIVEIAAVPVFKGKIFMNKAFHSLVNPHVRIPALIQKVHGITNEEIEEAPDMGTVYENFRDYVKGSVLVFHNANFDLAFLDMMAKETGNFPITNFYIDTLDISEEIFGRPHSLKWLCERLGIKDKIEHRALLDAKVTAKVFVRLIRLLGEHKVDDFIRRKRG
ncbi:PolC-type DNA polymerase III [Thermotoga sp. KOL6]|uniref:3'-5' exonuclease n=1 Tax=Thermotoga sp. KOL6 TaxID=126741 RepID=UPI000C787B4B|nr:3'-5' exonuclease [Thermotoga sp. KOL6]PLV59219.1 DNA polymerase III subunit epsilon [Thermotoga sp. KOL6]